MDIDKRYEEERDRLKNLLALFSVSENMVEAIEPIIENTAWLKVKLDDTRDAIKNSQVAIAYDNGGGQKGIRENPLFKGYSALWKSYMSGMDKILALLPQEVAQEATPKETPRTVLEIVRSRHNSA